MKIKKIFALTLALCMFCAMSQAEVLNPVANPMANYATYEELCAALPGVPLFAPPQDAEDISYCTIDGKVGQIEFTWQGDSYTQRAALINDDDLLDQIHGVMIKFDDDLDDDDVNLGFVIPKTVDEFELETNRNSADVLLSWYDETNGVGHTVYSATAGQKDMRILNLLKTYPEYAGAAATAK